MLSKQESLRHLLPDKTGEPVVSIITSIYDGDDFIENFMENICSQSIFLRDCELIIIDANSPGSEANVIEKFSERFKNISYIRHRDRISIYEAWNIGVEKAKGLFLTNANLDDTKRFDCLELQARYLIENQDIDIVYSDYAYSLEPNLPFELSCLEGHQTLLPVADFESLLVFNSPHCAPMWRASIHHSQGLFDASLRSAGDMEMWLKASFAGHKLGKINETLVSYYFNPKGLSTDSSGVGQIEGSSIIKKYQEAYHQRTLLENEPVERDVELTLADSQQVVVHLPDNRLPVPQKNFGHSSYFAFSMYKSGSTLLTDILDLALDQKESPRPKVDVSKQMFKAGIDGRDWMVDPAFKSVTLSGYYYIGFREFCPYLEDVSVFQSAKKVLLVRDPRDALVSFYYSVLKSHRITEGGFGDSQKEFREQVKTIDIDEFVRDQCEWMKNIHKAYINSPAMQKGLKVYKYESVIFDKVAWIDDVLSHLNIDISLPRKKFIWNHVHIVPSSEDSQKHIRTVVPGDHKKKISQETISYLNSELNEILKHYGYVF